MFSVGFPQVDRPSLPEGIPSSGGLPHRQVLQICYRLLHLEVERLLLQRVTFVLLQASSAGPVCGTSGYDLATLPDFHHSRCLNDEIVKPGSLVGLRTFQGWFVLRQSEAGRVARDLALCFGLSMLAIRPNSYLMAHDGQV